jgi:hypothetical protein
VTVAGWGCALDMLRLLAPPRVSAARVRAADILEDKREELAEGATATAQRLREPQNAALAGVSAATALSLLVAPHETFRFLGVLGLELTLLVKLLSYDSPQAAVADVERGFSSVIDAVSTGTVKLQRSNKGGVAADVPPVVIDEQPSRMAAEMPAVVIDEQPVAQLPRKSTKKIANGNGQKVANGNGKTLSVAMPEGSDSGPL